MANKALKSTSPTEFVEREACFHCGSTEGCYQFIKFEQRHEYTWEGDSISMWDEKQTGETWATLTEAKKAAPKIYATEQSQ